MGLLSKKETTPFCGMEFSTDLAHIGYMTNRIRYFRQVAGLTREQLAGRMGISTSQVTKLERGERRLTQDWMQKIADALHVGVTDLLEVQSARLTSVPLLGWVSAGDLARDDIADEALGSLEVAGLGVGDWLALRVKGDSMDRISPPDSIIIVNRKDQRLVANACYVIADESGEATYKRYRPSPSRFEPVSTNPVHEPIFPDREPTIVGRVKLSMLEM